MGSSSVSGFSPEFTSNAAQAVLDSRDKEKRELAGLNDRLASYIEKVRFLEAQNRKLAADLEALRGRWGKDTAGIKAQFEGELADARRLLDDTGKAKADIEVQIARLQEELAEYRKKLDEELHARDSDKEKIQALVSQLSDAEAEIGLLRRRLQSLEDETNRLKKENDRLTGELQKARLDLDQETLNRIDYQNQVQTLLEEIEFLRRVHEQEIKELEALANKDSTADTREFFRNELAMAIRDIRNEYDQITAANKTDMESWYKLKVQEVQSATQRQSMDTAFSREEVKRLRSHLGDLRGKLGDLEGRNSILEKQVQELTYQLEDDQRQYETALNDRDAQIRKMREECQALMIELQMLLDTKQTLDAEIAIYRKMLEGEESRAGLKQMVESTIRSHGVHATDHVGHRSHDEHHHLTSSSISAHSGTGGGLSAGGIQGYHAAGHEHYGTPGSREGHSVVRILSGNEQQQIGGAGPGGAREGHSADSTRVIRGEVATRTSFQRSAKGNVSIQECHPEGKYIILENTHRTKEESLDSWKIKRNIDGRKEIVYTLPIQYVLRPESTVKVWARNQGGRHDGVHELIFDGEDTWGTGSNVSTLLFNRDGEERATHIQRTSQQHTA
jgi:intermediate filament protein if